MFPQSNISYVRIIRPTYENAQAIKRLTLQDLKAGGFKNPLELADPSNHNQVLEQREKLRKHPERYSGYVRDGEVVAYLKQNEWMSADELPFASGLWAIILKVTLALNIKSVRRQWGVLGLVVSDEFTDGEREYLLTTLLIDSFSDSTHHKRQPVNIVLHDNDPLLTIIPKFGFVPVGKRAEAAGAPGLLQQRYRRIVLR